MILRTGKLSVGYGKKTVVRDINIEALRGQFICLLGPNGSGKSTILKTLIKMISPMQGAVYLNDKDVSQMSGREIALTTAVVLTEPISSGLLTAHEIVMMGRHPHTGLLGRATENDMKKVAEALDMVSAGELAARYFVELSDGEKQKVLLARALAQEPRLVVLDEPTSHLDARHRIEVMLILRKLTKENGLTVVASMHDLDLAMKACDVALLIKDEIILACGAPEDILTGELVGKLYDMEKAVFSSVLGGVELTGQGGEPVFVVAGAGTGAGVYRALNKHGFSIITGVLPENDVDSHIAKALGATVVNGRAYEEIAEDEIEKGLKLMSATNRLVDTGFPVGAGNRANIELIKRALDTGKIVYTFRSEEEVGQMFKAQQKTVRCGNLEQLVASLLTGD